MKKKYFRTLTIAGSDSGGGAGIQADLKTFAALGCYGMSVVTALTAQNTKTVKSIHEVPPHFIGEQMDAIMEDIGVDAVKIGMLQNSKIISVVSEKIRQWNIERIVLDPVMVSKSGYQLLNEGTITTLKNELIPLATLITPNIPEAGLLLGKAIQTESEMENAAQKLLALGAEAVLLKGGHLKGLTSPDCLAFYESGATTLLWMGGERVLTQNTHGTGCTLSAAIAAKLSLGLPLVEAIKQAKHYLSQAIQSGSEYEIGGEHGPVHHFFNWWE